VTRFLYRGELHKKREVRVVVWLSSRENSEKVAVCGIETCNAVWFERVSCLGCLRFDTFAHEAGVQEIFLDHVDFVCDGNNLRMGICMCCSFFSFLKIGNCMCCSFFSFLKIGNCMCCKFFSFDNCMCCSFFSFGCSFFSFEIGDCMCCSSFLLIIACVAVSFLLKLVIACVAVLFF
jgi:hypothetical protein